MCIHLPLPPSLVLFSLQEFAIEGPGPCHALAVNGDPIPFETDLFKGVVAVYIRHLPTTPLHMFKGKKRLAWVALQVHGGARVEREAEGEGGGCTVLWERGVGGGGMLQVEGGR